MSNNIYYAVQQLQIYIMALNPMRERNCDQLNNSCILMDMCDMKLDFHCICDFSESITQYAMNEYDLMMMGYNRHECSCFHYKSMYNS